MSEDVQVWLTRPVELEALLSDSPWTVEASGIWIRPAGKWQLLVGPLDRVEAEDVPDEVAAVASGEIGWLVGITLEGRRAGEAARELRLLCDRVAADGKGVVEDASGLRGRDGTELPLKRRPKPEQIDLLRLSWIWTNDAPPQTADGLSRLLAHMEALVPEALPRRWGLTEPPQNRLDQQGLDGFIAFVEANREEVVVWSPTLPVRTVMFNDHRMWKFDAGFAANRLTVDFDVPALHKRGNGRRLARAFEVMADTIQPFYAEARVLRGFRVIRPYDVQSEPDRTDVDPLTSNLWRGVPRKPPRAVAVGGPYLDKWPALEHIARRSEDLRMVCPETLTAADPVVPPPPDDIAQRFDPYWRWFEHRYPNGQSFPAVTGEHPEEVPTYWPF